jgi:alanine racemase
MFTTKYLEEYTNRSNPVPGKSSRLPRSLALLDSNALKKNYQVIQNLVPAQEILPMLKANAYGHGLAWTARNLLTMKGLYGFGVATLEEGATLRQLLGTAAWNIPIIVFSESSPWSDERGYYCSEYTLTPTISSEEDWYSFLRRGWVARLRYELEFDTGMKRLGISLSSASKIASDLRSLPSAYHPAGIFSHLSMSESPGSNLSRHQLSQFESIRNVFSFVSSGTRFHLANSGAIWNHFDFELGRLTNVVRPGMTLYGVRPWLRAPIRGIAPVMRFVANVLSTRSLKPGESIGYGGSFTLAGATSIRVAILGAGYADGIKRQLGNRGHVWLGGQPRPFLGHVGMDLCAVECSETTQIGDWAEVLGPNIDLWEQAEAAGTIPDELLTSISDRVKRLDIVESITSTKNERRSEEV